MLRSSTNLKLVARLPWEVHSLVWVIDPPLLRFNTHYCNYPTAMLLSLHVMNTDSARLGDDY